MSDPTAAKRLRTEARKTCAGLEAASLKLLQLANRLSADPFPLVDPKDVREVAIALAQQGDRLSMAAEMAHTRRKR